MRRNQNTAKWLLLFLKAGGLASLFLLPFTVGLTPPSAQNASLPSPSPNAYDPAVKELLDTTYLGHKNNLPDPGEPVEVLQKYLEQNGHGYHDRLTTQGKKLDNDLAAWKNLVRRYPHSRHAQVALAKHYRAKAIASGDIAYTRQAADAYISAAEIGLMNGRIRYTRQLSQLLGELGDRKGLDEIFGRILAQPKDMDSDHYYLALVHYANELAGFSNDRAWGYFEEAIALHPENNLEAINRYAESLLNRGQPQKTLEILDTYLTPEMRARYVLPAQLRRQALEQAGLDTTSADAEITLITQRLEGGWSVASAASRESTLASVETTGAGTETAVIATSVHDPRVSTIFAVPPDNSRTTADERIIKQDAIFSPNSAMNNRWANINPTTTVLKLSTLKWSNGAAGLVRIGTDNAVYYRYFNGSSWGTWQSLGGLPSGTPQDLAAAVYANGQADIFAVSSDCNIYSKHSTNGQTWGAWGWWNSCGDKLDVAILPDGTGWAALRVPQVSNYVAVMYFNGSSWGGVWTYPPGTTAQTISDVSLLAYLPPICCVKLTLWGVGTDNSSIYYRNWDGANWSAWTLWTTGFKQVSSFSTSDGGAYLLLIGTNNKLYTERFTGTAWAVITPQGGSRTWIAAVGVNVDDDVSENVTEHTEYSDDCRVQSYTNGPVCDNFGNCFWTQGVNLAEVIYNEAGTETPGAQDTVGWTVRNRAFQGLSCDSYPGGINWHTSCSPQPCQPCSTLPCNQGSPDFCTNNNTRWYCCAIHGGQTQWGTSGYQLNDEHVDINTLSSSGVIWEAFYVGNGWVPDVSTNWCPPGVIGCSFSCSDPGSVDGDNFNDPSPNGPMEFRSYDYCAAASSCKRYVADVCGNSGSQLLPDSPCGQTSQANDNFFWNRR